MLDCIIFCYKMFFVRVKRAVVWDYKHVCGGARLCRGPREFTLLLSFDGEFACSNVVDRVSLPMLCTMLRVLHQL